MDHVFTKGTVSPTPTPAPASPLTGYPVTSGTPGMSTQPGAYWFYMISEELRNIELAAGITPDPHSVSQFASAITQLVGNITRKNNSWVTQRSDPVRPVFDTTTHATTLDFSQSSYFNLGVIGFNVVLANPINVKPGQSGVFIVSQDAVGNRFIGYGSLFEFPGNSLPVLSKGAYATDVLAYVVMPSGKIRVALVGKSVGATQGTNVPAGTLLTQYCSGFTLMGVYADGNGGTTETAIEAYSLSCGGIARGVELSRYCSGTTLVGRYADGAGSYYDQNIEVNSVTCGYTPYVPGNQTWSTPGTYTFTVPPGVSSLTVTGCGGGGAGGGLVDTFNSQDYGCSGGGSSGHLATNVSIPVTAGRSLTVYVGAGGASFGAGTATRIVDNTSGATLLNLLGGNPGQNLTSIKSWEGYAGTCPAFAAPITGHNGLPVTPGSGGTYIGGNGAPGLFGIGGGVGVVAVSNYNTSFTAAAATSPGAGGAGAGTTNCNNGGGAIGGAGGPGYLHLVW